VGSERTDRNAKREHSGGGRYPVHVFRVALR
jgi:hypothetical protein